MTVSGCAACGGSLETDVDVPCSRCGARYHAECWSFVGSCQAPGCGTSPAAAGRRRRRRSPEEDGIVFLSEGAATPPAARRAAAPPVVRGGGASVRTGAASGLVAAMGAGITASVLGVPTIGLFPVAVGIGLTAGLLAPALARPLKERSGALLRAGLLLSLFALQLPTGSLLLGFLGVLGIGLTSYALAERWTQGSGKDSPGARFRAAWGIHVALNLLHFASFGIGLPSLTVLAFLAGESFFFTAAAFPALERARRALGPDASEEDALPAGLLEGPEL